MKDHAIISKFMGVWHSNKALAWWINMKWKPKVHYNLQLGSKGFFIEIFLNLKDKDKVSEIDPYFDYVVIYLRFWTKNFSPHKQDFTYAPVWICLYSSPIDY